MDCRRIAEQVLVDYIWEQEQLDEPYKNVRIMTAECLLRMSPDMDWDPSEIIDSYIYAMRKLNCHRKDFEIYQNIYIETAYLLSNLIEKEIIIKGGHNYGI